MLYSIVLGGTLPAVATWVASRRGAPWNAAGAGPARAEGAPPMVCRSCGAFLVSSDRAGRGGVAVRCTHCTHCRRLALVEPIPGARTAARGGARHRGRAFVPLG